MVRTIGAVIVGYVTMVVVVFLSFSLAYLLMGSEGAFQPGSYEVTAVWSATSLVLGLAAAIVGGLVCALTARGSRAPQALAALVVVLGLLFAIPALTGPGAEEAGPREGEIGVLEAMQNTSQPVWLVLLNPVIGAVGVLVGARMVAGRGAEDAV